MGGSDKLLEKVDNKPILRHITAVATSTACPVFVALPAASSQRLKALAGLAVTQVEVEDAGQGMSASIRAGIGVLPKSATGAMMVLADMPDLNRADLALLLDRFAANPDRVIRATDTTGEPGHPVIFPARLFSDLMKLSGDAGARDMLISETIITVALPGRHATTDLDTPEQWLAWRRANPLRN